MAQQPGDILKEVIGDYVFQLANAMSQNQQLSELLKNATERLKVLEPPVPEPVPTNVVSFPPPAPELVIPNE